MARGINKVIIVGNLGDDPKVTNMKDGSVVANFSVATSDSWIDRNSGNREERTEWHRIVAFRRLGDIVAQYLRKGSKVYVEGRLQTRSWKDNTGTDRYVTEIVANELTMLGSVSEQVESESHVPIPVSQVAIEPVNSSPNSSASEGYDFDVPF